jgi:trigger factor
MRSEVTEISPVLVEVKIEVPWEDVRKEMEDGFGRAQRTARIKGFRPGKVPRNVVKQLFGPQVKQESLSSLVQKGLLAAMTEHDLEPVASPEVTPSPLDEGQPMSFTAKLEIRPRIANLDTEGLEVARPSAEIADADIDREIERLRLENATVAAPEPARPAQKGDLLVIDYEVHLGGARREDMGATDRPVELDGERLLPEFEAGLIGANVGDEKSIEVKFQDDHGNADLRGQAAEFRVTVKELKERILPAVDDEFAKDCGDFQTLLELRLDIRKRLEESARRRAEGTLRDLVVERLVDKNPIVVPPSMVKEEQQQMVQEFAQFLAMTGQTTTPLSEEMHATMSTRAERKVRAALLLGELARRESLSTKPEEIEQRLAEIAARTGKHIAKVRVDYAGERRAELSAQILQDKLLDYLLSKATIVDAPATSAGASAAEGAG